MANIDNSHRAQRERFFEFLKEKPVSCSMAEAETGIHQKCLTRYKRQLESANRLWVAFEAKCKITGRLVQYITTNPEFNPSNNQLNIFDDE